MKTTRWVVEQLKTKGDPDRVCEKEIRQSLK